MENWIGIANMTLHNFDLDGACKLSTQDVTDFPTLNTLPGTWSRDPHGPSTTGGLGLKSLGSWLLELFS